MAGGGDAGEWGRGRGRGRDGRRGGRRAGGYAVGERDGVFLGGGGDCVVGEGGGGVVEEAAGGGGDGGVGQYCVLRAQGRDLMVRGWTRGLR